MRNSIKNYELRIKNFMGEVILFLCFEKIVNCHIIQIYKI